MADELQHIVRSARAAGYEVMIESARCKSCGFLFGETKLTKPGKCPSCKGTRLYEPLIRLEKW
jgi:transcriptional regulator